MEVHIQFKEKLGKETHINLQSDETNCILICKRNCYRAVGRGNNYSGRIKNLFITLWQMEKGSPATVTKTTILNSNLKVLSSLGTMFGCNTVQSFWGS